MMDKLPIGIESFEEIRTLGFYYVDKTAMICELLQNWGKVNLFTRPRRFGKSLNMSMLKYFFEPGGNPALFEGLAISREKELCRQYMGKFPVISISLKGVEGRDYDTAYSSLCAVIGREALRFQFLSESDKLTRKEHLLYDQLTTPDTSLEGSFAMSESTLEDSLLTLCQLLQKHYGCKIILLIDEYDVPLEKAWHFGYYDRMVLMLRKLFIQGLKSNESLHFAVLTGCLRISKESIFTGLNNPKIMSVTSPRFQNAFGFTDPEVRDLLSYYGLSEHYDTVKSWYDGYQLGDINLYCPWDVVNYCDDLRADPEMMPQNYWSNTSSNDIVKQFLIQSSKQTRNELELLIEGKLIAKEIRQELTYKELNDSIDNLWSILFTTGYLTQRGRSEGNKINLAIPNKEIREIFVSQIMEWFQKNARKDLRTLDAFCLAFSKGDAAAVETQFNTYLKQTISIRDTYAKKAQKENFYHGILLGLLSHMQSWGVYSNAESGDGYSDILVKNYDEEIGMIIEVKYAENGAFDTGCAKALAQIEKMRYTEFLSEDGITTVYKYGIACYKKCCRVVLG